MDTFCVISAIDPVPTSSNLTPSLPNMLYKSLLFVAITGAITLGSVPTSASSTPPQISSVASNGRQTAFDAMQLLDNLPTAWTSPEAISVDSGTILLAKTVLLTLPKHVPIPHVSTSADGEIALSWIEDDDRFEAVVTPDGHLVWASKVRDVYELGDDIDANYKPDIVRFCRSLERFYGGA